MLELTYLTLTIDYCISICETPWESLWKKLMTCS